MVAPKLKFPFTQSGLFIFVSLSITSPYQRRRFWINVYLTLHYKMSTIYFKVKDVLKGVITCLVTERCVLWYNSSIKSYFKVDTTNSCLKLLDKNKWSIQNYSNKSINMIDNFLYVAKQCSPTKLLPFYGLVTPFNRSNGSFENLSIISLYRPQNLDLNI